MSGTNILETVVAILASGLLFHAYVTLGDRWSTYRWKKKNEVADKHLFNRTYNPLRDDGSAIFSEED